MNTLAPTTVYEIVERQEQQFNSVLACNDVLWEREKGFAVQALQSNKTLNDTAWRNQTSLINAVTNIASIGISLNPVKKHAYLVPRDGGVCLDISYMGLMHLAMSSNSIVWGQSKIVYSGDTYKNVGIDKAPIHEQDTFGIKGDVIGVYCSVKLPSGDILTEEMDLAAIVKIQNTSKAKNGPWKTWFEQMARKSVVKRAYNYWPQNERMATAVSMLNDNEGLINDSHQSAEKDMGQAEVVQEFYPEEKFTQLLPKWIKAVEAGKITKDEVMAKAASQAPLTEEQKTEISNIGSAS